MLQGQCRTTDQSPALLRASKCNGGKDLNVLRFSFPWVVLQGMSCRVSLPIRNRRVARFLKVDSAGLRAPDWEVRDPELIRIAWPLVLCSSRFPSLRGSGLL